MKKLCLRGKSLLQTREGSLQSHKELSIEESLYQFLYCIELKKYPFPLNRHYLEKPPPLLGLKEGEKCTLS